MFSETILANKIKTDVQSQGLLYDGKESNFFSLKIYAKIEQKLSVFVAKHNSWLPTNFQLNIFIFEARTSLQALLQSLKQNAKKSARLENTTNKPSFTCDLVLHGSSDLRHCPQRN